MEKTIEQQIKEIKDEIAYLKQDKENELKFFMGIKNRYETDGENHETIACGSGHDDEIEILEKKLKKLKKQQKH